MSLNSVLKNSGKFFGVKLGKTVASFGNKLASYEIKKEEFTIANDQIFFKKLNLTLPYQKAFPILEGYEDALKLIARKGVLFFKDADENILIKIDNAEFKINDEDDLVNMRNRFYIFKNMILRTHYYREFEIFILKTEGNNIL